VRRWSVRATCLSAQVSCAARAMLHGAGCGDEDLRRRIIMVGHAASCRCTCASKAAAEQ
jgi:hypothetical protein